MTNTVKLYRNPVAQNAAQGPIFGICFSGGGTRAMSCALGQIAALTTLPDPADSTKKLMDRVTIISSVSGGTWGSLPYIYQPEIMGNKPITNKDFLISPQSPSSLYKGTKRDNHPANMSFMASTCLGTAPDNFAPLNIYRFLRTWIEHAAEHDLPLSQLWTEIISAFILEPFDLSKLGYTTGTNLPDRFFSLSADYVENNILPSNTSLTTADFYYPHPQRPLHITNYNLMQEIKDAPQVPVQATPVHTGIPGQSPDGALKGGGACESFGFSSTLTGGTKTEATVEIKRRYSLCDITACSSAFYAQTLQQIVADFLDSAEKDFLWIKDDEQLIRKYLLRKRENLPRIRNKLPRFKQSLQDKDYAALVPQYPYWSLNAVGDDNHTQNYGFSDGGTFENTGLLGLLAQTSGDIQAIAFINCELPLSFADNGTVIADDQLSRLFGYKGFDKAKGSYPSYGGLNPSEPMSYAQLFTDSKGGFNDLLTQLAKNASDNSNSLGKNTAWARQTLTTIDNPVAAITAGRNIEVLWVYNTPNARWQEQILDADLQKDLKAGQALLPSGELENFPNYSTFTQFHLENYPVNMLAQLKAWEVKELAGVIGDMVE